VVSVVEADTEPVFHKVESNLWFAVKKGKKKPGLALKTSSTADASRSTFFLTCWHWIFNRNGIHFKKRPDLPPPLRAFYESLVMFYKTLVCGAEPSPAIPQVFEPFIAYVRSSYLLHKLKHLITVSEE
jgi:hypothetical protein